MQYIFCSGHSVFVWLNDFLNAVTNLVIAFTVVWAPGISVSRLRFVCRVNTHITIIRTKKKHCLAVSTFRLFSRNVGMNEKEQTEQQKCPYNWAHFVYIIICNNKLFLFWSGRRTKKTKETLTKQYFVFTRLGLRLSVWFVLALKACKWNTIDHPAIAFRIGFG